MLLEEGKHRRIVQTAQIRSGFRVFKRADEIAARTVQLRQVRASRRQKTALLRQSASVRYRTASQYVVVDDVLLTNTLGIVTRNAAQRCGAWRGRRGDDST
ncbi:hypothetical protein [Dokdonella soli]|uniref:hypothetical protein n=1 Tax=Dokdonella soli TaxID=529810 RepID=UPI0031CE8BDD